MPEKPRLAVVSYLAHDPFEPRGTRTRAIIDAVQGAWDVEVLAAAHTGPVERGSTLRRAVSFAYYQLMRSAMLDRTEPWSRRRFRHWHPDVDAALLIGFPFAPVALAARHLRSRGIPYVVDASDPWALTAARNIIEIGNGLRLLALRRAAREERRLWAGACGAIVTTDAQAEPVRRLFPHLRILVRPNGFRGHAAQPATELTPHDRNELRIGHFGSIYAPRVDMIGFFSALADSGRWRRIVLYQYGDDRVNVLPRLPGLVEVRQRAPVPWPEVVALSATLDFALVVGNVGGIQLPSKVVDYLTLPVPRVALIENTTDDAICRYVADKPGWLSLAYDDPRAADALGEFLAADRTPADLAAPDSESWPAVGREIARFIASCTGSPGRPAGRPSPLAELLGQDRAQPAR